MLSLAKKHHKIFTRFKRSQRSLLVLLEKNLSNQLLQTNFISVIYTFTVA